MLDDLLSRTYLNNSLQDYLIFVGIFLAGILMIHLLKNIILHRLKRWSEKTHTTVDDFLIHIIEGKLIPLLYFGSLYLSAESLDLTPFAIKIIDVSGVILLTFFGLRLIVALINYSLESYWVKKEVDENRQRSLKGIITVIKAVIWGIGITFLLDNLGFEISTVVAGLGIGGIAVALAAQTILGDLFSYFTIFFDRPFEIGDFIIIGDIRNYKRMEKRRIVFKLGVTYQTTTDQLKDVPVIIKDAIDNVNNTAFDRAHFSSYGDFSLVFEVVYYVLSGDYNKYMDTQQEINFAIKKEFEDCSIEFAYPTQTLFVEKNEGNQ
jgi:small-conductance mechanosensitive channel